MLAALVLAAARRRPPSAGRRSAAMRRRRKPDVRAADRRAVEQRVALPDAAIEVTVEDVRIRGGVAAAGLRATPTPAAAPAGRFASSSTPPAPVRPARASALGSADAVVRVRTPTCAARARWRRHDPRAGRRGRRRPAIPGACRCSRCRSRRARRRPAAPRRRRRRRHRRRRGRRRAAGPQRRRGGHGASRRRRWWRRAAPPRSRTARSARSSASRSSNRGCADASAAAGEVEITP